MSVTRLIQVIIIYKINFTRDIIISLVIISLNPQLLTLKLLFHSENIYWLLGAKIGHCFISNRYFSGADIRKQRDSIEYSFISVLIIF